MSKSKSEKHNEHLNNAADALWGGLGLTRYRDGWGWLKTPEALFLLMDELGLTPLKVYFVQRVLICQKRGTEPYATELRLDPKTVTRIVKDLGPRDKGGKGYLEIKPEKKRRFDKKTGKVQFSTIQNYDLTGLFKAMAKLVGITSEDAQAPAQAAKTEPEPETQTAAIPAASAPKDQTEAEPATNAAIPASPPQAQPVKPDATPAAEAPATSAPSVDLSTFSIQPGMWVHFPAKWLVKGTGEVQREGYDDGTWILTLPNGESLETERRDKLAIAVPPRAQVEKQLPLITEQFFDLISGGYTQELIDARALWDYFAACARSYGIEVPTIEQQWEQRKKFEADPRWVELRDKVNDTSGLLSVYERAFAQTLDDAYRGKIEATKVEHTRYLAERLEIEREITEGHRPPVPAATAITETVAIPVEVPAEVAGIVAEPTERLLQVNLKDHPLFSPQIDATKLLTPAEPKPVKQDWMSAPQRGPSLEEEMHRVLASVIAPNMPIPKIVEVSDDQSRTPEAAGSSRPVL